MQEQLKALPISDIYPNPFQPRIEFSDEELAELSQSISENGLIQPVIDRNPCSRKGSLRSRES